MTELIATARNQSLVRQLFNDGSRWYVLSVLWDHEREGLPIPEVYLR